MQKAEPQRNQVHSQPAQRQGGSAALESPQGEKVAQLEAMVEASPQAGRLAQLAAMANSSPRITAQRKAINAIHTSPNVTVQWQQVDRLTGETAQREEAEEPLQPKVAQREAAPAKPNNTGLPDNLKSGIENLSGISMDNVKVHYNSSQPAQLNALAYAQGTDIHVAPGQEQHLPHEAWHVVQQAQGRVQPTMQMKGGVPVNDDQSLEHEADVMGEKAVQTKLLEKMTRHGPVNALQAMAINRPIQRNSESRNVVLTGPDETVSIEAHDTLARMNAPITANNDRASPDRIRAQAGSPAYVANIISTAQGKDKTAAQTAAQYRAEAFASAEDARERFALVYLANREDKPWLPPDAQLAERSSGQAGTIDGFPTTAGYAFWERTWKIGGKSKTSSEVRAILARAEEPEAAKTAIEAAAGVVGWPSSEVPNKARNAVKEIPATNQYIDAFRDKGYKPFVHVGDADAVTLKVPAAPNAEATSLFERYDTLIGDNPEAYALSGGYRFAKKTGMDGGAPLHSAGADLAGKGLMADTEQVVSSSELDMNVRTAMASQHGMAPYFPEPNLLVEGSLYESVATNFGERGPEWEEFRNKIILKKAADWFDTINPPFVPWNNVAKKGGYFAFPIDTVLPASFRAEMVSYQATNAWAVRGNKEGLILKYAQAYVLSDPAKAGFVFDTSAALVTDVGRFDREYTTSGGDGVGGSGTDYMAGEEDPLALFDARAAQSHVKLRAILTSISKIFDLPGAANQEWLQLVFKALVPQSLYQELSNSRELDDEEEATRRAATQRAVAELQRVQPHLQHYAAFTTAVTSLIGGGTVVSVTKAKVRERLQLGDDAVVGADQYTMPDKAAAVKVELGRLNVPGGMLDTLRDGIGQECEAIWMATTSTTAPGSMREILALVKSVSDTIATYLKDYPADH